MNEEQVPAFVDLLDAPEAEAALAQIEAGAPLLQVRKAVERFAPLGLCPSLLDSLECRHRFRDKFEQAKLWCLTRAAAEQATPSKVARWRATLLKEHWGPGKELVELGCGLGGDSVFLQSAFQLTAYERDPVRAALARTNLERLSSALALSSPPGPPKVLSREADIETLQTDLLYSDPSRRDKDKARRLFRAEDWSPPLPVLLAGLLQGRYRGLAVKANPGFEPSQPDQLPSTAQLHFVSIAGALKECLILVGGSAGATGRVRRMAWVSPGPGEAFQSVESDPEDRRPPCLGTPPEAGTYLLNPDPAVVRARGLGALCDRWEAALVHPKIAYLVGSSPVDSPLAQCFRIVESMPLDWRTLGETLKALAWCHLEILARGVPFSVEDARKRLRRSLLKRSTKALGGSLVLYRDVKGYRALLAQRIELPLH